MIAPTDALQISRQSTPDVAEHLEHALEQRWRRYRKAFDRCRQESSEDPVHQLRVETRRLLALLNLLDSLVGGKELEALRRVLDPALADAGLRIRGQAIVTQHVRTAFSRVVALRRRIDPRRSQTIHRTRVAFKRFRYLMELLQPLLPGASLRHLQEMHDYQTLMGEIQDLEVLQSALDQFTETDVAAAQELERFRREMERQHDQLITRYVAHADQLLRFWPVKSASARRRRPSRSR